MAVFPQRRTAEEIATRVQQVLASRSLTIADAARQSQSRYPGHIAYRIPHHFYADLRAEGFSPRMEQVLALSAITNYRLVDWLNLLGFTLDDLPRLAASLPTERTVLLDSSVYDGEESVAWFRSKLVREPAPVVAPLGQFLEPGPLHRLKSLLPRGPSPFLYAKVGRRDAFAFPDLLPGSIVRIDTRIQPKQKHSTAPAASPSLFLVEHSKGLTCCRLHISGNNLITLRSTELAYAEVALQLGREARVLGQLDLEFRFLANAPEPEVTPDVARTWNPQDIPSLSAKQDFAEFAKQGRSQAGLSLREASARSRLIAKAMGDDGYFCARGTLAGYEAADGPPRHIHKILALSVLYSAGFWRVLAAAGWRTDALGTDPIPRAVFEAGSRLRGKTLVQHPSEFVGDFLSGIVKNVEEVPFFLRTSFDALTGLESLSLRDVVWLGGSRPSFHPYLRGALLAAVNRRQRKPPPMGTKRLWEEPLYLLLRRDGTYVCARCTLQDKTLVVHPFADGFVRPLLLRNGIDAEVVGRVVTLVRRL